MRSQYLNLVSERDDIQTQFDEKQNSFVETVNRFNQWQTKLMKNKLDLDEAHTSFQGFKQELEVLNQDMDEIESKLLDNIEEHNSLLRRITNALKLYTNYDITITYQ